MNAHAARGQVRVSCIPPLPPSSCKRSNATTRPRPLWDQAPPAHAHPKSASEEGVIRGFNPDSAVRNLQLPIPAQDVQKRKRVGVLTGAYSVWKACWPAVCFLTSPSPHPHAFAGALWRAGRSPPLWGRGSMALMRTGIFHVSIRPKSYCCIRVEGDARKPVRSIGRWGREIHLRFSGVWEDLV